MGFVIFEIEIIEYAGFNEWIDEMYQQQEEYEEYPNLDLDVEN